MMIQYWYVLGDYREIWKDDEDKDKVERSRGDRVRDYGSLLEKDLK